MTRILIAGYLGGVLIGLLVMRDRWPARILTAALWPLGLVAFVIVVVVLLLAAAYLWPVTALVALALAAAAWYLF